MIDHQVRVHPSAARLPREEQLAWKLAVVAAGTQEAGELDPDAAAMAANRIIDNASVAVASLLRRPVAVARAQAQRAVITAVRRTLEAINRDGDSGAVHDDMASFAERERIVRTAEYLAIGS